MLQKSISRVDSSPQWWTEGYPHIWLPYTQMKTAAPALAVVRTSGSCIELADGRSLIDGIASWWTACHGYNHPTIAQAIQTQLADMPHVMFGGLAHEPALMLAKRLCACLGPGFDRVFFTESGSVSVEVAMKMALQFWLNQGINHRTRFLVFQNSYHGDTFGTMAVCDSKTGMHRQFNDLLAQHHITELPRDSQLLHTLEVFLDTHACHLAGILVEPLVQGAGGMLFHSPKVLEHLRRLADHYGLLLIFDEIFTGFGRTGSLFAFEQSAIRPDIITLSKALTGGTLPLAATVASRKVFDAFWSDDPTHALMHGPTFMANALACAAALASLNLFDSEPRLAQVEVISHTLQQGLSECEACPWVEEVRVLGAIGVIQLDRIEDRESLKYRLIQAGVWLRPFGNIVYLTPAYTISTEDLNILIKAVVTVICAKRP